MATKGRKPLREGMPSLSPSRWSRNWLAASCAGNAADPFELTDSCAAPLEVGKAPAHTLVPVTSTQSPTTLMCLCRLHISTASSCQTKKRSQRPARTTRKTTKVRTAAMVRETAMLKDQGSHWRNVTGDAGVRRSRNPLRLLARSRGGGLVEGRELSCGRLAASRALAGAPQPIGAGWACIGCVGSGADWRRKRATTDRQTGSKKFCISFALHVSHGTG